MPRRSHIRRRRNKILKLDGAGVHRHQVKATTSIQENIEGLIAVVTLLDEIGCETFADSDGVELKSTTTMMRAALTSIGESAIDIAIGLGQLRALGGLEGVTLDDAADGD